MNCATLNYAWTHAMQRESPYKNKVKTKNLILFCFSIDLAFLAASSYR